MTYAAAVLLDAGLVFVADTRTNAGIDHVSTFRKMTVFQEQGDRVLVLMGSGNLSITQSAVNQIHDWNNAGRTPKGRRSRSLFKARTMFEAARIVGAALRETEEIDGKHLEAHGSDFNAMFILGGQIKGEQPRLFLVYSAGNFIEATADTRYFQIGEIKYGKPILDRVVKSDTTLSDATKCVLISFDSTMRSNVSVAMPLDLLVYETDTLKVEHYRRIPRNDPYMTALSDGWSQGLLSAFAAVPDPAWEGSNQALPPRRRRGKA